eukprot:11190657-Alexandrium_andersonii.AAC.1
MPCRLGFYSSTGTQQKEHTWANAANQCRVTLASVTLAVRATTPRAVAGTSSNHCRSLKPWDVPATKARQECGDHAQAQAVHRCVWSSLQLCFFSSQASAHQASAHS